ncbi:hypothetical protein EXW15_10960 [Enterococcus faecium]|nr:hypothetical protein [Enterococcus faecium]
MFFYYSTLFDSRFKTLQQNRKENAKEFFEQGASYLGLGSGMFNKQDIEELNVKNLARSMKELIEAIK